MLRPSLRRAYWFCFFIWFTAIGCLFVATVWGNFDDFLQYLNRNFATTEEKLSEDIRQDVIKTEKLVINEIQQPVQPTPLVVPPETSSKPIKLSKGIVLRTNYTSTESSFEANLTITGSPKEIRQFKVPSPPTTAIDIMGNWKYGPEVINYTRFESGIIQSIIFGMHKDKLRVVFRIREGETRKISLPLITRNKKELKLKIIAEE